MDLAGGGSKGFWSEQVEPAPPLELPLGPAELLTEALAGTKVGRWQLNLTTGEVTWDATAARMIGLTEPGVSNSVLTVHEADRQRVEQSLELCFREGVAHDLEFRAVRGDGELRWFHTLAHPLEPGGESLRHLTGIVTDITDRKTAEARLQESERQLRAIIESLPGVAYRCGIEPPWRIAFISESVERLTGYTAAEFVDGRIDWNAITLPEDRPLVDATVGRAVANRERFELDYRITRRSGEVRWVHERGGAAYDDEGRPLFLEGFIGDVHEHKLAEEKLREAEERYRLISRSTMDAVWDVDLRTGEQIANHASGEFFGYAPDDVAAGRNWWLDKVHGDDIERVRGELNAALAEGSSQYDTELRFRRADGGFAAVYSCVHIIYDAAGSPVRIVGAMQDLTARKLADMALRESEAINRSIVESSTDCVLLLDHEANVLFVNETGARVAGMTDPSVLIGKQWDTLSRGEIRAAVRSALRAALAGRPGRFSAGGQISTGEQRHWDVVVSPVFGEDGAVGKLVAILRDITDAKRAEEKLLWAATRDPLTGLGNRSFFQQILGRAVPRAKEEGHSIGLMLLDLDDFKQVNDTLGHDAGDALLKALAERLSRSCPEATLVARLGGDEFAVLFENLGDRPLAERAAAVLQVLREPVVHAGRILDCNVTIGAAVCPEHGRTPEDLLKSADIALYAAKGSRRGGFVTFQHEHRAEMQERLSMIGCARMAVRHDRILPFYQPKVALDGGGLHGFEALLRWRHARQGVQLPATIAAAFEDLDLASAISDKIVDRVISDMRGWLDRGLEFGHVAINAAAAEFRRDDFAESVLERLARAGVPPARLQLEVTETVFLGRGAEYVSRALKLLSEAGVSIALDDFGTGYASLRHLKQFPVHVIKIDRSFVRDMSTDPDDAAIIEAVLNLGRSLKIEGVAEGIEARQQQARLRELGCVYGQGFLYSPAVRPERVPKLIRAWSARTSRWAA